MAFRSHASGFGHSTSFFIQMSYLQIFTLVDMVCFDLMAVIRVKGGLLCYVMLIF